MENSKISSHQGTQAPQAARSRPGSDAAGATASPGGFLALLTALEEVEVSVDGQQIDMKGDAADTGVDLAKAASNAGSAVANLPDMASDAVSQWVDPSTMTAWQGFALPNSGPSALPSVNSAEGEGGVFSNLQSQTRALDLGGGLNGLSTATDRSGEGWSAIATTSGMRQGLVAETALLDGAADLQDAGLQGSVSGYGRILSRMQSTLAQRTVNGGSGGFPDVTPGAGGIGKTFQHSAMTFQPLARGVQTGGESAVAIAGQSASGQVERAGVLWSGAVASESLPTGGGGVMGALIAAGGGDSPRGGRPGEGEFGNGVWSDGVVGSTPLEAGGVDGTSAFADQTQAGAEEFVTDQVAYWVNQKTQNAELTLDREGQPVEVSVSLSGNEAHVTFRSDQPETRELLDRSMAQLSDLLRSEGLLLSGMSVGTSAGGEADRGQPRNREGGRQAQVVSSVPEGTVAIPRTGSTTERTVDIYV